MGRGSTMTGGPAKRRRAAINHVRKQPSSNVGLRQQLEQRIRELNEAREQQIATSEVLNVIRRSPADAQPVFDAIVESAARLCGAIFSVVYLYEAGRLHVAATRNFTADAANQVYSWQDFKEPSRSNAGGRSVLDRAIVHIPDVLADPEYSREFALAGGWRAVLAVPLLRDGKPVGAVTAGKAEPAPFSDAQIQLLKTFADQALIAIENVQLFESEQSRTRDLSEALEQQTATSEVLEVISVSAGDLEPVFQKMLENATRVCGAKFGSMLMLEGEVARQVALYNVPPAYADMYGARTFRPHPKGGAGQVIRTKQVAHIADLRTNPAYLEGDPNIVALSDLAGARTFVIVPMLKEAKLVGTIGVYRQEVRPFTDKQIELRTQFRQAGGDRHREHRGIARSTNCANLCSSRPRPPTCSR